WLLRPARRARLQLRIHLRELRPLPDRPRVRPRPPPPPRPRRQPRPDRPSRPLRPDPHRHPTPTRLTPPRPVVGAAEQPSDHRHIPVLLDRITGISADSARKRSAPTGRPIRAQIPPESGGGSRRRQATHGRGHAGALPRRRTSGRVPPATAPERP